MTYARGLAVVGALFTILVLGASGWLIAVANTWASDDMHIGHGHSSFPPQAPFSPGEARP
jgi:hypothetical protein